MTQGASYDYALVNNAITMTQAPVSGTVLLASYKTRQVRSMVQEPLNGLINGSNVMYSLSYTPYSLSSILIYKNGITLSRNNDYYLSNTGKDIHMVSAPVSVTILLSQYQV